MKLLVLFSTVVVVASGDSSKYDFDNLELQPVNIKEDGYFKARTAERRCKRVGQYLAHPRDDCKYLVCDYGPEPWYDTRGYIQLFTRELSCPPGLSVDKRVFARDANYHANPCIVYDGDCHVSKPVVSYTKNGRKTYIAAPPPFNRMPNANINLPKFPPFQRYQKNLEKIKHGKSKHMYPMNDEQSSYDEVPDAKQDGRSSKYRPQSNFRAGPFALSFSEEKKSFPVSSPEEERNYPTRDYTRSVYTPQLRPEYVEQVQQLRPLRDGEKRQFPQITFPAPRARDPNQREDIASRIKNMVRNFQIATAYKTAKHPLFNSRANRKPLLNYPPYYKPQMPVKNTYNPPRVSTKNADDGYPADYIPEGYADPNSEEETNERTNTKQDNELLY